MEERYRSMIVVDLMLTRKNGNDKEIKSGVFYDNSDFVNLDK